MTLRISELRIYPVKALQGHAVDEMTIEPCGPAGDRRWMVTDPTGRALTQRQVPRMATIAAHLIPAGLRLTLGTDTLELPEPTDAAADVVVWGTQVRAADAGDEAATWLGHALDQPCRLVFMADPRARPVKSALAHPGEHVSFADGFPLLVTNDASLATLNAHLPTLIGMDRFRTNIAIAGAAPWAEDTWTRLRIGTAEFRVIHPCARCIVTTVDQRTGERPIRTEPLRTLSTLHRDPGGEITFGQNLIPERLGVIHVGDEVELDL